MEVQEQIIKELHKVPRQHYNEILLFIRSKREKTKKSVAQTAHASESSLRKDWLRPEEDEAWANL